MSGERTEKTTALVLIGNEMRGAHGAPSTRAAIAEFLWELPWLQIDVTGEWDWLRWERIAPYDVVIQYAGNRSHACTPDQLAGLRRFVERGGGYVPLHFTTANADADFLAFVGASFNGHPPHGPFQVRVSDADHPITHGLGNIDIEDECYRSVLPDRTSLRVLMTSHHPDPKEAIDGEPSAWVKEIGRGRLFYSALGHDARSFSHPGLRELLTRGIRWAAGLEPVAS
jgi:type 1 glutamine amidotransferase